MARRHLFSDLCARLTPGARIATEAEALWLGDLIAPYRSYR
jgi:hypothetical protein